MKVKTLRNLLCMADDDTEVKVITNGFEFGVKQVYIGNIGKDEILEIEVEHD